MPDYAQAQYDPAVSTRQKAATGNPYSGKFNTTDKHDPYTSPANSFSTLINPDPKIAASAVMDGVTAADPMPEHALTIGDPTPEPESSSPVSVEAPVAESSTPETPKHGTFNPNAFKTSETPVASSPKESSDIDWGGIAKFLGNAGKGVLGAIGTGLGAYGQGLSNAGGTGEYNPTYLNNKYKQEQLIQARDLANKYGISLNEIAGMNARQLWALQNNIDLANLGWLRSVGAEGYANGEGEIGAQGAQNRATYEANMKAKIRALQQYLPSLMGTIGNTGAGMNPATTPYAQQMANGSIWQPGFGSSAGTASQQDQALQQWQTDKALGLINSF